MPDELITIGNFQFLPEAEAARMHLAAQGIPAFVADGETVNMDWFLGNAVAYIKLQVPVAQAAAARAALDDMRALAKRREGSGREKADVSVCLVFLQSSIDTWTLSTPRSVAFLSRPSSRGRAV